MPKIQDIYRSQLILGLKILIVVIGSGFIITYLSEYNRDNILLTSDLSLEKIVLIFMVLFVFSSLNWWGEIKKWKELATVLTLRDATRQSLISHGFSIFTPQKIGELGAKCLFFKKSERLKVIGLSGFGHLSQLFVTLFFGFTGVIYLSSKMDFPDTISLKWTWAFLALPCVFFIRPLRNWCHKIFNTIRSIDTKKKWKVLKWSFFRHIAFSQQFVFLLWIFDWQIPYTTAFFGISTVYFLASLLPVLSIADAVIKGSLALTVFGLLGYHSPAILMIVFLTWVSNTMIPAVLGYLWMFRWQPEFLSARA
jgi:hypothetical protein